MIPTFRSTVENYWNPGNARSAESETDACACRCLEALSQSATVTARSWLQPSPEARHRRDALGSALRRQPGSTSSAQSGSKRSHADVCGPAVLATVPSLPVLTEDSNGCQSAGGSLRQATHDNIN